MNLGKRTDGAMLFKSARIAGAECGPNDMAQINGYALAPLTPENVFVFKVSMATNEVDRDYEVFPRSTLTKLANLFVGKTVVKDHEHRSDNQIARIFGTELVENDLARTTKTGEAFTELIAKCYMVKTEKNADLIAEIQAGIRKEVSLGCRVDKAVCSICGTDNVKAYCDHFPGKRYGGNQLCYFSLENASDAYELSFVAVPAQPRAGTVKAYGGKLCREDEKLKAAGSPLNDVDSTLECKGSGGNQLENDDEDTLKSADRTADSPGSPPLGSADAPGSASAETPNREKSHDQEADAIDAKEMLRQLHEIAQQLLAFQKSVIAQKEAEQSAPMLKTEQDFEQKSGEPKDESPAHGRDSGDKRLMVNRINAEGRQGEPPSEHVPDAKVEAEADAEESKAKAAKARLRALDLALSLRSKN